MTDYHTEDMELDPVYEHSRREALLIFFVWALAFAWSVPYCYVYGFDAVDPATLKTIWGIPSWVFWGIGCPWFVADIFTVWLCFFYMSDDDLGENQPANTAGSNAVEEPQQNEGRPA